MSQNSRFAVISLADGVSECENAAEGARLALSVANELFLTCGELLFTYPAEKIAYLVLEEIKARLSNLPHKAESYASTLALACFDKKSRCLLTLKLGDSRIFLGTQTRVFPTASLISQSFTATDGAWRECEVKFYREDINFVLLASDGAWRNFYKERTLDESVEKALLSKNYSFLDSFLQGKNQDDCSYAILDLSLM